MNGLTHYDSPRAGILKYVVGLPSSTPEWVFVDAAGSKIPATGLAVDVTANRTVELTGILRGDVDGSWAV